MFEGTPVELALGRKCTDFCRTAVRSKTTAVTLIFSVIIMSGSISFGVLGRPYSYMTYSGVMKVILLGKLLQGAGDHSDLTICP